MSEILDGKRLVMGTCYYPEHWPEKMWEDDLRRMKESGIEVLRIAEFAWSKFEPEEGAYNQLTQWKFRGYIEEADGKYKKTTTAEPESFT